jgi:hypothetical protein
LLCNCPFRNDFDLALVFSRHFFFAWPPFDFFSLLAVTLVSVCVGEGLYPAGLPLTTNGYAKAGISAAKAACKQIHVLKGARKLKPRAHTYLIFILLFDVVFLFAIIICEWHAVVNVRRPLCQVVGTGHQRRRGARRHVQNA